MLVLPKESRKLFKDPFGILHRDFSTVLPELAGRAVYSVGDVVTHNLQKNGIIPDVAVVDGYTMRSPCSRMPNVTGACISVKNPAGTLTNELIAALDQAVAHPPTTIVVDGEEDLAVIPMVIAAPIGAVVPYGQPQEGVVFRTVTPEAKETAQHFLKHFIHT